MSINFITFLSFCWYFLVSTEIIPLAIAPVRDAAPNAQPTGILMNAANVATLDIPVAMLIPLEQAFNNVNRFNILVYFLYFFLNIFSLAIKFIIFSLSLDHVQMVSNLRRASGGADRRFGYIL